METLKKTLAAISIRQRILILAAALAVGAGIFYFVHWQHEDRFRPLFTSLSPEDAAAIMQKLKETGTEYRILDSGSGVLVASDRVAEVRLQMASAGLPKTGRIGFELFDKTNFGATDFAEHINFLRALEGELERSVMSLSEVEQARVHVTFSKESVFLESRQPAKASVLIRLRPGAKLGSGSVVAIAHLVSSAVEGLNPEAVSVLDMRGNLLNRPRRQSGGEFADQPENLLEYQQQIERNLMAKINSTLEPMLGAEKFRAAVSVDCESTSAEQSEEMFDPTRSVMLTSQKSEDTSSSGGGPASSGVPSGIPGTAANLPRSDSPVQRSVSGLSRRSESITYQSSRTIRKTKIPQGVIRRLSVSVLLDQAVRWEGTGQKARRILLPPPPEQMKVIRDLVSGAIAFNSTRGDQLIVETIPFESTVNAEPPPAAATSEAPARPVNPLDALKTNRYLVWGASGAGGIVLIGAGLAFMRRRNRKAAGKTDASVVAMPAIAPGTSDSSSSQELALGNLPMIGSSSETDGTTADLAKKAEQIALSLREGSTKDAELFALTLESWILEGSK